MSTKYEYYDSGDDAASGIHGLRERAQSFTPSTTHTVSMVYMKLYRIGSPGEFYVNIKETDGAGKPTGDNLCSGTKSGSTITTDTDGAWYGLSMGAGGSLTATQQYAIIAKAEYGNADNKVNWLQDESSPTYTGGNVIYSNDAGSSWTLNTGADMMFEEWGEGTDYPIVYTLECANTIAQKSTGHGIINSIGGSAVTQHGHCWNTSTNPTTSNDKTTNGATPNLGHFTSLITGLTPGTKYYVRAYATNTTGTAYGANVEIAGDVTTIGKREWWTEKTKFHYFDEYGAERAIEGDPETGGIPWWRYT